MATEVKNIIYETNILDEEFDKFWSRVSCYAANQFPFEERCEFVLRAESCNKSTNVVPYMRLLACDLKCVNMFQEALFVTMIVSLCINIVILLSYVTHTFYTPALKAVAKYLHMNEHLAGVTLLAFGNTSADLFANLASVKDDVPLIGNSTASALFVVLISGGLVSYLSPFQMNGYESSRDVLFLILGSSMLYFFIANDGTMSNMECWLMFGVYVTYLVVNIVDVVLLRMTLRSIDAQITDLMDKQMTREVDAKLTYLERLQKKYSADWKVDIYERRSRTPTVSRMRFTTKLTICKPRVDQRKTKYIVYDSRRDPNRGLFRRFFLGLRPIKCKEWQRADMLGRAYLLVQAPGVILCNTFIPQVDYELNRHGWNKLLNCIQLMITPPMIIAFMKAKLVAAGNELWYVQLKHTYQFGMYSLLITIPISVYMLFQTRTDVPPPYHWIFTVLSLCASMFMIFLCATEIDKAIEVIGHIVDIKSDFMGSTVTACTANLGTVIANTAMAKDGYPKMAYASAIGGPLFTVIFSVSTLMLIRNYFGTKTNQLLLSGLYGEMAYTFLLMGLFSTLLWATTLGFFARRCVGIFCIILYLIYALFALLIHSQVIHSFSKDPAVHAAIGDV